ncbi:hypothetical protein FB480_104229 [Agrobacterium vitis]|nr:hypothetical protein FB480_104229 [Agrobacterium vitis]
MVDVWALPITLRDPSPTPPHKGEGLNPLPPLFLPKKASPQRHPKKRIQTVRHPSPSPLWGGVGEGFFTGYWEGSSLQHSRHPA